MYYVLIMDGIVHQNIPEIDPAFPDIPIEARFSPDLLAKCVTSDEAMPEGWMYDAEMGAFSEPPAPEPRPEPEPVEIEPDVANDLEALAIDHEFRITLLELGVM